MTKSLKVFLIFIFLLFTARSMAQVQPVRDESMITELKSTEPAANKAIVKNDDNQNKDKDKKNESVKQVKSARPDMSKSRGARPPDIVRPSGSRIPKGVGRPAGAGRHGRG